MINPKQILTNGVFCPMPWTGLMYNFDGAVKNCIRSAAPIGNLQHAPIQEILANADNTDTQTRMLADQPGKNCWPCYELENKKKNFDIISDRIFYIRELKNVPLDTYQVGRHDLHTIDVRWSNLCNFACVYCGPDWSSRWASDLNISKATPTDQQVEDFKQYVLDHAAQLRHVYLAGGEPLLIKQNFELLQELKRVNPQVNIRVNTNLSKVDTKIFDLICEFANVQWIISVESLEREYEYIRFGGCWQDFCDNLKHVMTLPHKISFNMLWLILNHWSLFDSVDHFLDLGFHPNSFIIGTLFQPDYLNIRHLPDHVLHSLQHELQQRINQHPGYLLEDGYQNLLKYIQNPVPKDLTKTFRRLKELDLARGIDSSKIFPGLYSLQKEIHHGQTV